MQVMTKENLFEFIKKQKTAFISSVDENGFPVTRAMLCPREIDGNDIYFSTNTSSRKVEQYKKITKRVFIFTNGAGSNIKASPLRARWRFAPTNRPRIEFGDSVTSYFINKA